MSILDFLKDQYVTGGIAAIIASLLTYFGIRSQAASQAAPDIQNSLNAGVAEVVKHYTTALEDARKAIYELKIEVNALQRTTDELRRTIHSQSEEIEILNDHIVDLTSAMVKAGLNPPQRDRPSTARTIQIS
jgi:peptidoglycan hydrolase CwlO-like protein